MRTFGDESGIFWLTPERMGHGGKRTAMPKQPRKPPESDWVAPTEFPRITDGTVAIDFETKDPRIKTHGPGWHRTDGGHIVGVALAWGQGERGYWPIAHEGGGNLDATMVKRWVRDIIKNPNVTKVCHNAVYEMGWARRDIGVDFAGQVYDTRTMTALLDEYRYSYELDPIAKDYLGVGKDETLLKAAARAYGIHEKQELYKLPAQYVGPYGEGDALRTLELFHHLLPELDAQGLRRVFELETAIQPLLVEMRWRGVRVDIARAERVTKELLLEEQQLRKELGGLNEWDAEAIAKLFRKEGLTYPTTPKTKAPSFKAAWLEEHTHPMAQKIVRLRRVNKLRVTFMQGYILDAHVNGRVHGQYHALRSDDGGAVSGRFSSSAPNLTNLPARDEGAGLAVRGCFLPEEGEQWLVADYSQQEPRLTVHYAALANVRGAHKAVAAYHENPNLDWHSFMSEITGLPRGEAKQLNLGKGYGMGGAKFCRTLGLPTKWVWSNRLKKEIEVAGEEGQAIIDQYDRKAPFVKGLYQLCEKQAKAQGYIYTILGRRCRFDGRESPHKAMNRLVQGSAADQLKTAALMMYQEGIIPLAMVHDEMDPSVPDVVRAKRVKQIMIEAIPLKVPVKVECKMGPSWGEAVKVAA